MFIPFESYLLWHVLTSFLTLFRQKSNLKLPIGLHSIVERFLRVTVINNFNNFSSPGFKQSKLTLRIILQLLVGSDLEPKRYNTDIML